MCYCIYQIKEVPVFYLIYTINGENVSDKYLVIQHSIRYTKGKQNCILGLYRCRIKNRHFLLPKFMIILLRKETRKMKTWKILTANSINLNRTYCEDMFSFSCSISLDSQLLDNHGGKQVPYNKIIPIGRRLRT